MKDKKKYSLLEWFMIVMFSVSVSCVIIQVISRKVLNNSLPWCNEVARYSFLWVVFVGAAVMLGEEGHIAIDIALTSTPKKIKNILLLLNNICITIFLGLLTVMGVKLVISTHGSLSSALRLPINLILYMGMPIGMGMGLLIMLKRTWHQFLVVLGKAEAVGKYADNKEKEV